MYAPDIPIIGTTGRAKVAAMGLRSAGKGVLLLLLIAALAPAPSRPDVRSAGPSACVGTTPLAVATPCARHGA